MKFWNLNCHRWSHLTRVVKISHLKHVKLKYRMLSSVRAFRPLFSCFFFIALLLIHKHEDKHYRLYFRTVSNWYNPVSWEFPLWNRAQFLPGSRYPGWKWTNSWQRRWNLLLKVLQSSEIRSKRHDFTKRCPYLIETWCVRFEFVLKVHDNNSILLLRFLLHSQVKQGSDFCTWHQNIEYSQR